MPICYLSSFKFPEFLVCCLLCILPSCQSFFSHVYHPPQLQFQSFLSVVYHNSQLPEFLICCLSFSPVTRVSCPLCNILPGYKSFLSVVYHPPQLPEFLVHCLSSSPVTRFPIRCLSSSLVTGVSYPLSIILPSLASFPFLYMYFCHPSFFAEYHASCI